MKRKKLIAGNWKMNLEIAEAIKLATAVKDARASFKCDVALIPSHVFIADVKHIIYATGLHLGAQNCSIYENGAYTGEVSASQLKNVGVEYIIIGHSERREHFGEGNEVLKKKLEIAFKYALKPIFCCGEPLQVREEGKQKEYVLKQLEESLFGLSAKDFSNLTIAYEPIWAIGTGLNATDEQAQDMHAFIRQQLTAKHPIALQMRILYGGSCNPSNAKELFACPDVDGSLAGWGLIKGKRFSVNNTGRRMNYTIYEFFTKEEIERDWLISILGDYDFEGYEETNDSLKGYVPVGKVDDAKVKSILSDNEFEHITFSSNQMENKNWNEEWEKNFEPVVVDDRVAIRAPFHQPFNTGYEIIIEPKMSFGTGHHATTASMISLMLKEDIAGKSVLDFGSGTGVLAILAEKLKALNITAIDNEEWAYNNCIENIERNNCVAIKAIHGDDTFVFDRKFDLILANINRNVILKNIGYWKSLMNESGVMMVSGILQNDERDIIGKALSIGLEVKDKIKNNGWLAISFQQV